MLYSHAAIQFDLHLSRTSLHHHDACNLNWDTVTRWSLDDSTIYKQHVAPTLENVKLLLSYLATRRQTGRQIRVVVLTRDPMGCAACSLRAEAL